MIETLQIQRLIDLLSKTGLLKKAQSEMEAEQLRERKRLAAELAAVEKEGAAELPALAKAEQQAHSDYLAAAEAATKAHAAWVAAHVAGLGATHRHEHQRALIQRELRRTAPAAIAEYKTRWRDTEAALCRTHPDVASITEHTVSGGERRKVWSNWGSIMARLAAVRDGLKAADDIALRPLSEVEFRRELEKIENAFPETQAAQVTAA